MIGALDPRCKTRSGTGLATLCCSSSILLTGFPWRNIGRFGSPSCILAALLLSTVVLTVDPPVGAPLLIRGRSGSSSALPALDLSSFGFVSLGFCPEDDCVLASPPRFIVGRSGSSPPLPLLGFCSP